MPPIFSTWPTLRFKLHQWAHEHEQVAAEAAQSNRLRLSRLAPLSAAFSLLFALLFGLRWLAHEGHDITAQWLLALFWTHLSMGLFMLGLSRLSRLRLHSAGHAVARALPASWLIAQMAYTLCLTCVDQWVTPNITPFVLSNLLVGVLLHLRPTRSLALYLPAALLFSGAMGLVQPNPEQLLSNRINGLCGCMLGWGLSVLLWRKFCTITLQHRALERANAELQTKQRELERLSRLDGLTAVLNRATFVELTRNELARARRQGTPTSVLVLDLDHFKQINDRWGHPAGDAVLRHVAALCMGTVRSTDLVGRLGGEEFIVLLPATGPEAARSLAERLRLRIQDSPAAADGQSLSVRASIGVASAAAQESSSFETLYAQADQALYQAKQWGRNRVM